MTQSTGDLFYLIDECLSSKLADVFTIYGFNMTCVEKEFEGRLRVTDEEIIEWLGQHSQHKAIWITGDKAAQKNHAKLILDSSISVLWLHGPRGRNLSSIQELQLLSFVIEKVTEIALSTEMPVYLEASFNVTRARLQQVVSPLTAKQLSFKKIPL